MTASLRLASTVIVFSHKKHEILMLKRARQLAFFPNAWVFPGGRVDASDHEVPTMGVVEGLETPAYAVAAVRECFEEAGVWLGKGSPSTALRNALNARQGSLLDEEGLVADLERLHLFSRWVTPIAEPKRYDTFFFLTQLREDEPFQPQADQSETVDSGWFAPQDAIDAHRRGEVFLAPPTLLTLMELASFDTYEAVVASKRDISPIMPVHRKDPDLEILLPGHDGHAEEDRGLPCHRLRLQKGVWELD